MFSLFAGQNITTHMVCVFGEALIFFSSFIYIPKNSYTELLIHYFCGEAPKPHPKTGKSFLIHLNDYFVIIIFFLYFLKVSFFGIN